MTEAMTLEPAETIELGAELLAHRRDTIEAADRILVLGPAGLGAGKAR